MCFFLLSSPLSCLYFFTSQPNRITNIFWAHTMSIETFQNCNLLAYICCVPYLSTVDNLKIREQFIAGWEINQRRNYKTLNHNFQIEYCDVCAVEMLRDRRMTLKTCEENTIVKKNALMRDTICYKY